MPGGFIVTGSVHTELRFAELKTAIEVSINKALVEGAALTLDAVVSAETRVGDASPKRQVSPGVHLRDTFQVAIEQTRGFGGGFAAIIVWTDDPNAIWQELGTRQRRRKSLKSGAARHSQWAASNTPGNRGVKPLYFMRRGLRHAYPQVESLIASALAGVGEFGGGSTLVDTTTIARRDSLVGKRPL